MNGYSDEAGGGVVNPPLPKLKNNTSEQTIKYAYSHEGRDEGTLVGLTLQASLISLQRRLGGGLRRGSGLLPCW